MRNITIYYEFKKGIDTWASCLNDDKTLFKSTESMCNNHNLWSLFDEEIGLPCVHTLKYHKGIPEGCSSLIRSEYESHKLLYNYFNPKSVTMSAVSSFLLKHPKISDVMYDGLKDKKIASLNILYIMFQEMSYLKIHYEADEVRAVVWWDN